MTINDISNKVRIQYIEENSFWRSDNQEFKKEKRGEVWFLKNVKLVKLDWMTEKAITRHMTRGVTDAGNNVKNCLKQRPMSRNLELWGSHWESEMSEAQYT